MDLDIKQRLDDTFFNIMRLPLDAEKVRDLRKIWKNCSETWKEMSQEDVACRRLGRKTPRYLDLETELKDGLTLLEQYLTFASLLS
jgi:hypothetical protein